MLLFSAPSFSIPADTQLLGILKEIFLCGEKQEIFISCCMPFLLAGFA